MMKSRKISRLLMVQAFATSALMGSTQTYGFEGPITVLNAQYGDSFVFTYAPNVFNVRLPEQGPYTVLNLKYCITEPPLNFNCKRVIERATGRPLLSDLESVRGYKISQESSPYPISSRDIFQSHNLSFLIKPSVFKDPQFKGIGLHRHIVGINSNGISASNVYGPNEGGSFTPKSAISIAREVTLKNGETAYVVNFVVAHFYHQSGDSKTTKTTMITFRPNVVIGNDILWDKVAQDYYLFNRGGTGAFDRSAELL